MMDLGNSQEAVKALTKQVAALNISVNTNPLTSPGDTTLFGEVTTRGALIDLGGRDLQARGAITNGELGGVTLRGDNSVALFASVTAGRGPVDIEANGLGLRPVVSSA